ncbi:hypothetical protein H206_05649 [Candidatus Electrothrix aarhusensis]|uniref:Uncharacterized protein n=1 Tax=Candidatus Electrothrix aarhusensis TaxID=1859131 RepID=A0A3S4TCQ4_9BACT|nr:hypothetical protein H206_05649 [Candidatus Electrothrix aarhusensis]
MISHCCSLRPVEFAWSEYPTSSMLRVPSFQVV